MNFKKFIPILIAVLMLVSIGAASAANVNNTQISTSSSQVKSHVESNGGLPANVTVGTQKVTSSQFLYLLTKSTVNINSGNTNSIAIKNVAKPTKPSETVKSGTLTKSQYINLAKNVNTFITSNGRVPNYAKTSLGNMRYESLVYTYSKVLSYYKTNKKLPSTVSVKPWSSVTKSTTSTSVSRAQISKSAASVKSYIESNDKLPSTVTVGSQKVTAAQFLYLLAKGTVNTNSGNTNSIAIKNVAKPTKSSETVKSGTLTKSQYVTIANNIVNHITKNGKVPNYAATTKLGNIGYESLVYTYSKILSYYNTNKKLPSTVSVKPLSSGSYGPPAKLNGTVKYTSTLLGENSDGYALKLSSFGSGINKVAIIIGVHPQEVQTHIAMLNAIDALHSKLKNVKIYVFAVVVKNGLDYKTGREKGQNLANKYVVPNIDTSFKLVVDTHGHRGNNDYKYNNFIFAPSNGAKSVDYANKIISKTNGNLKYDGSIKGTSPQYVTIPIANKGIPTLVYEQYMNQANYAKVLYNNALQVVKSINTIFA